MNTLSFGRRFLHPVGIVLAMAVASWAGYFGSRYLQNDTLRQAFAAFFGTMYFISIAFGPLFIYTASYLRGARLGERIIASAVVPLLWATKESLMLLESYGIAESLYWYLNPLNFWLACLMALQIGLGGIIARAVLKRRGDSGRAVTPASVAVIICSLAAVILAFAWGKGENLYVIFLAGYRMLFGYGI